MTCTSFTRIKIPLLCTRYLRKYVLATFECKFPYVSEFFCFFIFYLSKLESSTFTRVRYANTFATAGSMTIWSWMTSKSFNEGVCRASRWARISTRVCELAAACRHARGVGPTTAKSPLLLCTTAWALCLCLTPPLSHALRHTLLAWKKGGSRGQATFTVIALMFQHTRVVRQRFRNKGKRAFCFLLATLPSAGGPPPLVPLSGVANSKKKKKTSFIYLREQIVLAENKSTRIEKKKQPQCLPMQTECRSKKKIINQEKKGEKIDGECKAHGSVALRALKVSQRLVYFCFPEAILMNKHAGVTCVRWQAQGGGALTRKGRRVKPRALSASSPLLFFFTRSESKFFFSTMSCPLTTLAPVVVVFF